MNTTFAAPTANVATQPLRLSGRWLTFARVGWCVLAIYPMALFALGIAPALNALRVPCDPSTCIHIHWGVLSPEQAQTLEASGISLEAYALYFTGLEVFQAMVYAGCGWLIFLRRSDEAIALIASLAIVSLGVYLIPNTPGSAFVAFPGLRPLLYFTFVWGNWLFPALLFLLPDGRLVPRWGLWFFVLWGGYATYGTLTHNPATSSPDDLINRLGAILLLSCAAAGVYGQVYRYVRVATQPQRQQIKWLGLGLMGILASALIGATVPSVPTSGGDTPIQVRLLATTLNIFGFSFFPIALTFAILRHRLWEIDLVLNRALVYGGLTAAIVAFYALIVGGLSAVFHAQGNSWMVFISAACAALLFQPLRERLQRAVNRLMFGQRDEPYAVLARLGRQLETSPALETLLPTVAATIRDTLKLPVVEIEVNSERSSVNSSSDRSACSLIAFPLLYQSEPVGSLIVAAREGETALSASDRRLLEDLARQAGVAVHAARVTAELQRARERLVTAREEERRRLRRDLHDGLGPTLAALTAQAEAARDLVPTRPDQSIAVLEDMVAQAQTATVDIRRLVYNLRPPALDDLGLVGALQAQTQKINQLNGLVVRMDADPLTSLPAAVEVAAYRIGQEALANVVRHAKAKHCQVTLHVEQEHLRLEIADDGRGLPAKVQAGVGLTSMRERAEELGGDFAVTAGHPGTKVTARLPMARITAHT